MNPFLKNASGASGQQLADRLIGRIEKARTAQPDPNEAYLQAQEQQAEQTKEQQAMQEQQIKAQEREQKQTEMKERQDKMHAQQKSDALARAGNTPSFKPYTIKQSSKRPLDWAKSLLTGRGAQYVGGTAVPTAVWDQTFYRGKDPDAGIIENAIGDGMSFDRFLNLVIGVTSGGAFTNKMRKAHKEDNLGMLWTYGTGMAAIPGLKTPAVAWAAGVPKTVSDNSKLRDLEIEKAQKEIDSVGAAQKGPDTNVTINQPVDSNAWKWLAGAGLGLAAIPAAAYAYKAFRKPDEEEEKRKRDQNPERVALEIPSHKISDSLYSRLGREILFEDDKEAERRAKKAASVMKQGSVLTDSQIQGLSSRAKGKAYRDKHTPGGAWNFVEGFAPVVSSLMGGPQLGNFQQRLTQHLVPLESKGVKPHIQKRWANVAQPKPRFQWTPGQEFNLTPNYNT